MQDTQQRMIPSFRLQITTTPDRLKVTLVEAPNLVRNTMPAHSDFESPLMGNYKSEEDLGRALYKSLFYDAQIRNKFEECRRLYCSGQVGDPVGLRLVLEILSNPDQDEPLLSLPWELLHDGQSWLACEPTLSLVRRLNVTRQGTQERISPPLRVLLAYAEPKDKPQFGGEQIFESIYQAVSQAVSAAQALRLAVLPRATKSKLKLLIQQGFHFVHFLGHGDVETQTAQLGRIFLELEESPLSDILTATELVGWIQDAAIRPRLFVFTACHSGSPTRFGFLGMATALSDAGVEAVVAMQTELYSDEAEVFVKAFYKALGVHRTVDDAMQAGRQQLYSYWRNRSLETDITRLLVLTDGQGSKPITRWHLGALGTFTGPENVRSVVRFPGWAVPVLFLHGDGWLGQGPPEPCIIWPSDRKEMVYIPEGNFYIDKYPVTCSEYRRFVSDAGLVWDTPPWEGDEGGYLPATNMSWQEARRYAEERGKRLPSVEEWRQAALSGIVDKTWPYPWGEDFRPGCCNTQQSGRRKPISVLAEDRHNRNPSGMCGIVGNVAEWAIDENGQGVLCGGSYKDSADNCTIQRKRRGQAEWGVGFRCIAHWSDIDRIGWNVQPCPREEDPNE